MSHSMTKQVELTAPYYAVIFSSILKQKEDDDSYGEMATRMEKQAAMQTGYLGIESVRDANGTGITISYWENLDSIRAWKKNLDHQVAQDLGQSQWYQKYTVKICRVEDAYSWNSKT